MSAPAKRGGSRPAAARATPCVLCATLLLTACASVDPAPVTVRHFPSTAFHEGARFHLFTFDPRIPRDLNARIALARSEIRSDPNCTWADAPTDVIREATERQGGSFTDTLLAAPVFCNT
jgi:ABC-type uncharacterized transport system auxiliary subunit